MLGVSKKTLTEIIMYIKSLMTLFMVFVSLNVASFACEGDEEQTDQTVAVNTDDEPVQE